MREDNREVQIFILKHSKIQDILVAVLVVLVINLIMAATVGMVMMVTALVPMTTFYIVAIMVVVVITALVVVPTLSMVPTPTQGALLQLETAPDYRLWQSAPNAMFLV